VSSLGETATMMNEDTEQHDNSAADNKGKLDWVYIGSLVIIAISLFGMVFIVWIHHGH
jgi:hypothetical protein